MFREIPFDPDFDEVEQSGLSAAFRRPIATCLETMRLVNIVCRLKIGFDTSIFYGYFHEIAFEIEVISLDGATESFATQDRNDAAGFIPAEARAKIIDAVAEGYRRLVDLIRPRYIFRVTKASVSIVKAKRKHDVLTRCLEAVGYSVIQAGIDQFGRGFWLMERQDS